MTDAAFSPELFEGHVGSGFRVTDGGSPLILVLDRLEVGPSSSRQVQYALFFRAEGDAPLDQRTYHLDHEALGGMDIFLVPVGRVERETEYQACFSHLAAPSQSRKP